ncbi:MAG: helix-turn-helix transcriptional regulator [Fimbriimonadaceae bacterium]|nr:MAG: helix-turn-helix transcriptional regulator [Fimbriimonadaceae bacterium]
MLDALRQLRRANGVTQDDMANRLGITQSALSKWERGERRMDVVEVRKYCICLEADFVQFITLFESQLAKHE